MSANIFDKVLKIIQVVVTILQFAIRSFTGIDIPDSDDLE